MEDALKKKWVKLSTREYIDMMQKSFDMVYPYPVYFSISSTEISRNNLYFNFTGDFFPKIRDYQYLNLYLLL